MADFIGTTNLLPGTVAGLDGQLATIVLSSGERCAVGRNGLAPGAAVELSIRPEVVHLRAGGTPDLRAGGTPANGASGRLSGRVEQAAYLGATFAYLVRTSGGLQLTVHAPKAEGRLEVGTDVDIEWRAEDALILGRGGSAGPVEEE